MMGSPPCKAHSTSRMRGKPSEEAMIAETRAAYHEVGGLYAIENVVGATAEMTDEPFLCSELEVLQPAVPPFRREDDGLSPELPCCCGRLPHGIRSPRLVSAPQLPHDLPHCVHVHAQQKAEGTRADDLVADFEFLNNLAIPETLIARQCKFPPGVQRLVLLLDSLPEELRGLLQPLPRRTCNAFTKRLFSALLQRRNPDQLPATPPIEAVLVAPVGADDIALCQAAHMRRNLTAPVVALALFCRPLVFSPARGRPRCRRCCLRSSERLRRRRLRLRLRLRPARWAWRRWRTTRRLRLRVRIRCRRRKAHRLIEQRVDWRRGLGPVAHCSQE